MKAHKPAVVSNGEGATWCRLCGIPVWSEFRKNGNHVARHYREDQTPERYPVLGEDLKPVQA